MDTNLTGNQPPSAVQTVARTMATNRIGARIDDRLRWFAGALGTLAIGYGGVLAWRDGVDGVAIASVFAVGLIGLVFGLSGVVPASVKIGDLELRLAQAHEQGKQEGKKEGTAQGVLQGVKAAAALRDQPAEQVHEKLRQALTGDQPLVVPGTDPFTDTLRLPMPLMDDPQEADRVAKELTEGLQPAAGTDG